MSLSQVLDMPSFEISEWRLFLLMKQQEEKDAYDNAR